MTAGKTSDRAHAGRVSIQTATAAYDFNNVIFAAARIPQIVKNFQVIEQTSCSVTESPGPRLLRCLHLQLAAA